MSDMGCDSFERGERLAAKAERAKIANKEKDKQRQQHTQWVQHFSGTGQMFKVVDELDHGYRVYCGGFCHTLPKPDYLLCPPPERWEVVTDAFTVTDEGKKVRRALLNGYMWLGQDERFIIRPDGALVVERKVP